MAKGRAGRAREEGEPPRARPPRTSIGQIWLSPLPSPLRNDVRIAAHYQST